MARKNDWSIAIAGECLVTRPFSMHSEPEFMGIASLLRESDVTYAHLEMNFGDHRDIGYPARGDWYGSYMLADGRVAEDLRWLGIDVMSTANNHSLDFGTKGLLSTIDVCKAAGIAVAGTGRDLDDARAPVFVETKRGRLALVSTSSGNTATEWASRPKAGMIGRPGVNALRVDTTYVVDREAATNLKEVAKRLGILRTSANTGVGKAGRHLAEDQFQFVMPGNQSSAGGGVFREGDEFKISTECNARDLEGNVRSIKSASSMSDLVLVAHHFNISEGSRGDTPPKFVRDFAHAAIDAGADMFLGHGWHKTLGIEIYHGKPIFYGLGNFFAQSEFLEHVPYDSYETWGHDVDRLPTLTPNAHPLHPGLDTPTPTWWSSAVITVQVTDGQISLIHLHPVEMGRDVTEHAEITRKTGNDKFPRTEGRPMLADPANGRRILERLQRVSSDYGTSIQIEEGVGVIRIAQDGFDHPREYMELREDELALE